MGEEVRMGGRKSWAPEVRGEVTLVTELAVEVSVMLELRDVLGECREEEEEKDSWADKSM